MNITSIGLTNGIPNSGNGNVSTIDALLAINPPALGQQTMANSYSVVTASNQSTIAVAFDTQFMASGVSGNTVTPVKTKISVAAGNTTGLPTTIVSGTASKKTRILAAYLVCNGAAQVNWQSHTTTATADGAQSLSNTGGWVLPFNPIGWLDTVAGEALDLNCINAAAFSVGGLVVTITV